jgi:hypothetical protein
MRVGRILIGAVLLSAVLTTPAGAGPRNAKPRIVSASAVAAPDRAVSVRVVGRDADDVVRGVEVRWGDGQPAQGYSACEISSHGADERRRGARARFDLAYTYPAAGDYVVTVRVLSGGCGKRKQQRSAARRLTVHVG